MSHNITYVCFQSPRGQQGCTSRACKCHIVAFLGEQTLVQPAVGAWVHCAVYSSHGSCP